MRYFIVVISLLVLALLPACGGKEHTYVEEQELKPGPGIFSGEDGAFTLYEGATSNKKEQEEKKETDMK